MSVFNLGLQSVGLMHEKQNEDFEKAAKCKNMNFVQQLINAQNSKPLY